jgi:tetratricopeptide (TPR) repeat protein
MTQGPNPGDQTREWADVYLNGGMAALRAALEAEGLEGRDMAAALNNVAAIFFQGGDSARAAALLEAVRTILRDDVGAAAEEALVLLNLAVVYGRMGELEAAERSATEGKAVLVDNGLDANAGGETVAGYDRLLEQIRERRARGD